ncbi:MAG: TIGR04076 family protein [Candidatus Heimdallarchaeota archaeon]|nr:TIGR04076 family protein [Candidatus Heimdallarchaeota archaeon]
MVLQVTKLKVSVVRRFKPEEVFGQEMTSPSGKVISVCSLFEDGQEFLVEEMKKPKDFCEWAWYDIYKDVSTLALGAGKDWREQKVYVCCTDGMRPVVFTIEKIET